ncbi:fasciclin domain-containing protein [Candidatus Cyanaurora vandensis]|uniref:fasciclin domain-containing protein n=1 Tax=Candidatus Cyanaurora vandensis TaxID=2714958 RepID=UPI002580EEC8|nr:fasciclin domain-containing protein [Candidatus Cyanaurora vandensis]
MQRTTPMGTGTVVDVASKNNNLKTFTAAVKAAGLTETLAGRGPYTVFAPSDAAFAALPAGTLDNLLKPENKTQLTQILTYHVVSGIAPSNKLQTGSVQTVNGSAVAVRVNASRSEITVGGAKPIVPDVQASNGIIHVIDKVLMPPKAASSMGGM